MHITWATQEPIKAKQSIFLAGPTPRSQDVRSWRPEAIATLNELGFSGELFIPESENGVFHGDYLHQVSWEQQCLELAKCIVFWVPRDLKTMPAFTTNIEWGAWYKSGKVVLGYPQSAPKMKYFAYCAKQYGVPISHDLKHTLEDAILLMESGPLAVLSSPRRYAEQSREDKHDSN